MMIAVALIFLQTIVSGIFAAQAFAAADLAGKLGVICHGAGQGGAASDQAADPVGGSGSHDRADCCIVCTVASAATLPAGTAAVTAYLSPVIIADPPDRRDVVLIPSRAIRAGPAQAPPRRA
jgi:hypothetical protein